MAPVFQETRSQQERIGAVVRDRILSTLAYHDVLHRPLTAWEIFIFGIVPEASSRARSGSSVYAEILEELEFLKKEGIVCGRNGYYMLSGREGLYAERIERLKISTEKLKSVLWVLGLYRAVPFVRAVFLSGSIAAGNATERSDVDVFVVTEPARIWTARFFLTLVTLLCGKLRAGRVSKKTAGKICLNHYVTLDSMELSARGLYNAATYVHLVPLWGEKLLVKFYEKNQWIFDFIPNSSFVIPAPYQSTGQAPAGIPACAEALAGRQNSGSLPVRQAGRMTCIKKSWNLRDDTTSHRLSFPESLPLRRIQRLLEAPLRGFFGNMFESGIAVVQSVFIRRNPLSKDAYGRIAAGAGELAFHPESPEKEILDKYTQKMLQLRRRENPRRLDKGR